MNLEDAKGFTLFDLDKTIVPQDMQLVFARFIISKEPWRVVFFIPFLFVLPFAPFMGFGTLKSYFMCFLCKMKKERFEQLCDQFVENRVPSFCYAQILKEIEMHRAAGRYLVLTSASPEFYVKRIGKKLGFHKSFGTRFKLPDRFGLKPELIGKNNKSAEKVRRLEEFFKAEEFSYTFPLPNSSAYSDSYVDIPLMEITEESNTVNGNKKLREWTDEHRFAKTNQINVSL